MFDSLTGKFNTNKCDGLKETFYGVTNYQTESGALNIKCSVYIYIYMLLLFCMFLSDFKYIYILNGRMASCWPDLLTLNHCELATRRQVPMIGDIERSFNQN